MNCSLVSFFCIWFSNFPSTIYRRGFLFFTVCFWFLCQKLFAHIHGFIYGLSILVHWSVCLFFCQYHAVLIIIAWRYNLMPGSVIPPALFFLKTALAIQGFVWFCTNVIIFCSISLKNIWILMGTALNLYIALGNMAILTMLILPIREHKITFHFIVSFSISFNSAL